MRLCPTARVLKGGFLIKLSEVEPLADGLSRRTYLHPGDPRYLLKLQVRELPGHKGRFRRKLRAEPSNTREMNGYADVLKRMGRKMDFMSEVYGLDDTDLGSALRVDNVAYGAEEA